MRRWFIAVALVLVMVWTVSAISYIVLEYFYGGRYLAASVRTIIIENGGERVTIDDIQYEVTNVEPADNENFYLLSLKSHKSFEALGDYDRNAVPAAPSYESDTITAQISILAWVYEQAQTTGGSVTISNTTTTETRPIDVLPIAASIGIAMGVMVLAVWAGYQRMWGGATSTLLEQGLHDMTVRDVEIVGHIMELREFTIPQLMKMTKASKLTVWRTVQKLVEKGLVQPTEKIKPAANGLGGRGKPSRIYMYVGGKK